MLSRIALRRTPGIYSLSTRSLTESTANAIALKNPTHPRTFSSSQPKMVVHNLSSKSDFDKALNEDGLMVLDCFATWCGPCKVIAPQIVKYSEEFPNVNFYKIDVDEVSDVAQELSIRAMPTFVFFKGGKKVTEVVGANPPAIKGAIEANL